MSRCEFLFLFGIYSPSRICRMVSFISFEKFSAMIFSNIVSFPLFLFLTYSPSSLWKLLELLYQVGLFLSQLFHCFLKLCSGLGSQLAVKQFLEKLLLGGEEGILQGRMWPKRISYLAPQCAWFLTEATGSGSGRCSASLLPTSIGHSDYLSSWEQQKGLWPLREGYGLVVPIQPFKSVLFLRNFLEIPLLNLKSLFHKDWGLQEHSAMWGQGTLPDSPLAHKGLPHLCLELHAHTLPIP